MRYFEYVKRTVPMHDDLYDFFHEALPGYDKVGYRETNLVCWGSFDDPDYVDYDYRNMTEWGRKRYITPGVVIDGELVSTDLVEINLMIRILLGSSYFEDWENEETYVTQDPLGQPGRQAPPLEQDDDPEAAEARLRRQVQLGRLAADLRQAHRHLRVLRHRRRPVRPPVVHREGRPRRLRVREGDRREHPDDAAEDRRARPRWSSSGRCPEKSNAIERDRARTYHQAYSALIGLHCLERAFTEVRAGRTKSWNNFKVPQEAVSVGFHEAARGVLSHHMVIQGRQDRQLPALPADAVERQRARLLRDSGALRGRGAEHADLRGERPGELQGRGHHAGGAELRSVPAVRRPHVRRRRPREEGRTHADGHVLTAEPNGMAVDEDATRGSAAGRSGPPHTTACPRTEVVRRRSSSASRS